MSTYRLDKPSSDDGDDGDDVSDPCYGPCDGCHILGQRVPIWQMAGKYWLCERCKALPDGASHYAP